MAHQPQSKQKNQTKNPSLATKKDPATPHDQELLETQQDVRKIEDVLANSANLLQKVGSELYLGAEYGPLDPEI